MVSKALTMTALVRSGRWSPSESQREAIRRYLEGFEGKPCVVTFAKPKSTRSLRANAFYWGVVLTTIAHETGNDIGDLHLAYKAMLLPPRFIKMGEKEVEISRTTAELNPGEFHEYITRVCAHAAQELGILIPEAVSC